MDSTLNLGSFLVSLLYGLIAGTALGIIFRWPAGWRGFLVVLILIPVAFYIGVSTGMIEFFGYHLRVNYMLVSFLAGLGLTFLYRIICGKRRRHQKP